MKKEFLQVKTLKEAKEEATWANFFKKVEGGYMAFESKTDFEIWKNQK